MISIIDYKAGNLTSVKRALDFLGIACAITQDADVIRKSRRIIFPGVGNAASAVPVIRERGIDAALAEAFSAGTPILGICLGTQIILSRSEEGDTECLGLIKGNVARFALSDPSLKVPHMGWNELLVRQEHVLLKDVLPGTQMYFVHSFYPRPERRLGRHCRMRIRNNLSLRHRHAQFVRDAVSPGKERPSRAFHT